MDNKQLFKSYRWHENVGAVVIGHEETTQEEQEKSKEECNKILKERGIKYKIGDKL